MAREAWTDQRLGDLNGKVDRLDDRMERGFADMRAEFRAVRSEIKGESDTLRAEIRGESLQTRSEIAAQTRSIQQMTLGLMGTMLVGFLGTIAAIVTQL